MTSLELQAVGDFSLIFQKFKYKQHKLFCIIKILPRLNMSNWLSSINMLQIESELMRICEDIDWKDWEGIANFNSELFIESSNIKIHIKAVHGLTLSIMTLMEDTIMPTRDIVLQIEVKHLPLDDKGAATPQAVELQNWTEQSVSEMKQRIFGETNNIELNPKLSAATSRAARSHAKPQAVELQNWTEPSVSEMKQRIFRETNNIELNSKLSAAASPAARSHAKPQAVELQKWTKPSVSEMKQRIFRETNNTKLNPKRSAATSRPARSHAKPMRYKDFILDDSKRRSKENRECAIAVRKLYDETLPNIYESTLERYSKFALNAVRGKPPQVKILLLPLTEDEILATFEKYRVYFDAFFEKNKHKTSVDSYEDIGLIDIADLLSDVIRLSMARKLIDNYAKNGFEPHVALCADGLCPLWTVRLFMDYHNLEHDAAVEHIKAQNMLTYYEEVHGDKALGSELEEW